MRSPPKLRTSLRFIGRIGSVEGNPYSRVLPLVRRNSCPSCNVLGCRRIYPSSAEEGQTATSRNAAKLPWQSGRGGAGQLMSNTTPAAQFEASRNFLMSRLAPPRLRSISSGRCQPNNSKELRPAKTKDLRAQFLERGICEPVASVAHRNWTAVPQQEGRRKRLSVRFKVSTFHFEMQDFRFLICRENGKPSVTGTSTPQ